MADTHVTALVLTRDHEGFVAGALASVLAQEYPAQALDVVVVDQGSSDATGAVVRAVAAQHPGRVQLIEQQGASRARAVLRGRAAAAGELVALIDGDDLWLPGKIAKQVDLFRGFPRLTAALCEAMVIDGQGRRVQRMVGRTAAIMRERAAAGDGAGTPMLARAVAGEITTRSALTVRAELVDDLPDDIEAVDWWLAMAAAYSGDIEFVPEILVAGRMRDRSRPPASDGFGTGTSAAAQAQLRWWTLRALDLRALTPDQMAAAWQAAQDDSHLASQPPAAEMTGELSGEDRQHLVSLRAQADAAGAAGDVNAQAALLLRTLALTPDDQTAAMRFHDAVARAGAAARLPHPLEGARELVVLASAEELLAEPQLLVGYGYAMRDVYSVTLAIDASRLPPGQAERELPQLVSSCGLGDRDDIDLLGVVMELDAAQRRRMLNRVMAVYRPAGTPADSGDSAAMSGAELDPMALAHLDTYTPETLELLREQSLGVSGVPGPGGDVAQAESRVQVSELPTVTVVMPAYNYAHFIERAITSAMDQEYPPNHLDLVVVDDGSKDDTAAIAAAVAQRYPGRVKVISQENAGATAALDRARTQASGELIGLLDADDMWLPQKTMKQVRLMRQQPGLGLVFSDMRTVDAHEQTLEPTVYGIPGDPNLARPFARVLRSNCAINSSILVHRDLFNPLPENASYADWWLTLNAARLSKIDLIREPLVLYRMHDGNLTHGVTGERRVREGRKQVEFMLWVFRHMDLSRLAVREIPEVWGGLESFAREAYLAAGTMMVSLTTVGEREREQARELTLQADAARQDGELGTEAILRLRARAWAPDEMQLVEAMGDAVNRAAAAGA